MAAPAQRDFRLGEVAPSFYGRADLGMYGSGLRTLRNAYVKRMGGITSRPGTLYKGTTKGSGAVVLVDAVFDDTENYVLEFGNLYVRVWKDGALVTVGTPAAWVTATAYTAGAVRSNGGTNYVCILAHTSGSSTEPGVGASWQTNWYALSGTTFEYPTDYTTAQLDALQFAAQYRVVTVVHPSHPPATLTFDANGLAVLADIDFASSSGALDTPVVSLDPDEPLANGVSWVVTAAIYDGATLLSESLGSDPQYTAIPKGSQGVVNAALSAAPKTIQFDTLDADANLVRIYRNSGGTDWYFITALDPARGDFVDNGSYTETTETVPADGPVQTFSSAGFYPGVVGAYQQRLILSGLTSRPDYVYASKGADTDDFGVSNPIVDSDALSWRQVGQRLNRVRFFREVAQRLIQFSSVGEVIVQGDVDGILRPGEVNPRLLSENGISPNVPPLVAGDAVLYVQARGNQVQDLWPDGSGSEISRTAWHLLDGYEVVSWCFQRVPDRVVWAVRDDGRLLSLTYNREDQVLGWALHDTDGSFERVVCVPEGDEDAVYVVVNRTINSSTVRYVERFANRLADVPVLMDAAKSVTMTAGVVTGLSHLEGEVVSVINATTGAVLASPHNPAYAGVTVTGGGFTITGGGSATAWVGLPVVTDIQTLDIETVNGTRKDAGILVNRIGLWLEDTLGLSARATAPSSSTSLDGFQSLPVVDEDGNTTTTPVTGYREVTVDGVWTRGGRIFLRNVDPTPVTIHSIAVQGQFGRS